MSIQTSRSAPHWFGQLLALIVLVSSSLSVLAEDSGRALWESARDAIVQVRVIERESDEKSSIGSGFLLAGHDVIVSNFHVVASAVHEPQKYSLQLLDSNGRTWSSTIVDFDVVHDLALLTVPEAVTASLAMASGLPEQGDAVYSLGNPFDLGQTIVPGTFNGLLEASFYQKLLFSGSLNPGMSGGPSINASGEVVGVNVASMGNQISFLVPASYLLALLDRRQDVVPITGYQDHISAQLQQDQQLKYQRLAATSWPTQQLGDAQVGGSLPAFFKCWGDTQDEDELDVVISRTSCTSQDSIYLSSSLQTGLIDYEYSFVRTDAMGGLRFHRWLSQQFSGMRTRTWPGKEDVSNYDCQQSVVSDADATDWRMVFCVRAYHQYDDFFDVLFQATSIKQADAALASHFALSGVSQANAEAFLDRFLGLQQWP